MIMHKKSDFIVEKYLAPGFNDAGKNNVGPWTLRVYVRRSNFSAWKALQFKCKRVRNKKNWKTIKERSCQADAI